MPPAPFHVLGAGSIGLLYAHHLRRAGAPVILQVRDWRAVERFQAGGCQITLEHSLRGRHEVRSVDAQAEAINPAAPAPGQAPPSRITNLLVATKAVDAVKAVRSVQHRLTRDSSLILLQNGVLAVYQELWRDIFSELDHPPKVILASTTHGCYMTKPFHVYHAGQGSCTLAEVDSTLPSLTDPGHQDMWHAAPSPAMRCLLGLRELGGQRADSHTALLHQLHLKLAVNCCINPLTALLQTTNGHLIHDSHTKEIMRMVCDELHALFGDKLAHTSREQLYTAVHEVAQATAHNKSSMFQDIQHGRITEIEHLNGYVVREGLQKQVATPISTMLYQLVKAKEKLAADSSHLHLPRSSMSDPV